MTTIMIARGASYWPRVTARASGPKPAQKALRLRAIELGVSFSTIARELGVSRQFVSQVVAGRRNTSHVRRYLCSKLKLDPKSISWSDLAA